MGASRKGGVGEGGHAFNILKDEFSGHETGSESVSVYLPVLALASVLHVEPGVMPQAANGLKRNEFPEPTCL